MPATKLRTALKSVGFTWDEFYKAAVDFSGSNPYRWVQPGSVAGEVVPATGLAGSNILPIGIAQNNPAAGGWVRVRVQGKSISSASLGACNINWGTWVTVGSYAGASTTGGSGMALARAVPASAVASASTAAWGGYVEVMLVGPSFSTCVSSPS